MNSRIVGLRVGSAVFGVMCLGQLVRLIARLNVTVGSHAIPLWPSAVALLVLATLSLWLWRLSLETAQAAVPPAALAFWRKLRPRCQVGRGLFVGGERAGGRENSVKVASGMNLRKFTLDRGKL